MAKTNEKATVKATETTTTETAPTPAPEAKAKPARYAPKEALSDLNQKVTVKVMPANAGHSMTRRFAWYKANEGKTVAEMLKLAKESGEGLINGRADLRWDLARGLVALEPVKQ